jgi:NAD(P)-dependent dehydrogenase (short-subunit alcohol dehydrogenase family)
MCLPPVNCKFNYYYGIGYTLRIFRGGGGVRGCWRCTGGEAGNVNNIAPGVTQNYALLTEKESWEQRESVMKKMIDQQQIVNRIQRPEDLVGAAIFLASSGSDTISRQTMVVDCGVTIH